MRPGTQEILILVLILLLLFGATRLPKLARSLREARDEFQKDDGEVEKGATPTAVESPKSDPPTPNGERPRDGT